MKYEEDCESCHSYLKHITKNTKMQFERKMKMKLLLHMIKKNIHAATNGAT